MVSKKYVAIFAALVLLIFLFWYSASAQTFFLESVSSVIDYTAIHPILGGLIFVGLAALSAMFSLFSSAVLVPVAILIWGSAVTFILLLAGWIIGDIIAYLIGFYAIHRFIENLIPFDKINYYRGKISKKTEFGLVLLFRFAVPSEIAGYLLGIIQYPFAKYLAATFLSELPFALIIVYASNALIAQNIATFVALIALAIIVTIATLYLLNKKIKNRDV